MLFKINFVYKSGLLHLRTLFAAPLDYREVALIVVGYRGCIICVFVDLCKVSQFFIIDILNDFLDSSIYFGKKEYMKEMCLEKLTFSMLDIRHEVI